MTQGSTADRFRVFSGSLRRTAENIVGRYPNPRSAVLPLLYIVQSVDGYLTEDGMREVGELLGLTAAEVLAAASFYTMLKKRPSGEYLISVCRNIPCTHSGARGVMDALERRLHIGEGETTPDGRFSLETAECLATCDGAPSLQINYEDFYRVTPEEAVALVDRLERGEPVTSVRGEPVKTAREVSYEIATAGLRVPGTAGDHERPTVGGEVHAPNPQLGFRPKVDSEEGAMAPGELGRETPQGPQSRRAGATGEVELAPEDEEDDGEEVEDDGGE